MSLFHVRLDGTLMHRPAPGSRQPGTGGGSLEVPGLQQAFLVCKGSLTKAVATTPGIVTNF